MNQKPVKLGLGQNPGNNPKIDGKRLAQTPNQKPVDEALAKMEGE